MKNVDSISKTIKDAYQYRLGELSSISIPDTLPQIIFCITFPVQKNERKQERLVVCQFTVNALTTSAFGFDCF